jgi:tetratricopeptide (TPR) repeat protein
VLIRIFLSVLLFFIFTPLASAEGRVPIEAAKTLRLTYGYPPWNKSPLKIDSATIILREGHSGQIVQINLEETEPDSSVFSGLFSLSWKNIESISPEFYIPPQELLNDKNGLEKITAMIKNNELKRKAFILRKNKNGLQLVEIYDTKDQAKLAMRALRGEEELTDQKSRPLIARSAIDAGFLAEQAAEQKKAAEALTERVRMEQVEAQKAAEAVRNFKLSSEIAQKKSQALAAETAASALADFKAGNTAQAVKKFEKAVELDPENKSFYFQYGIALYKAELFNRSLVMFTIAQENSKNTTTLVDPVEIQFYIGLDTYRLKQYQDAIIAFEKVVAAKHPTLSASANFYIGVCLFEQQDFAKAQTRFQNVLDSQSEKNLDARAEQYIEQILRIQEFEKSRAHKWNITGTLGFMYDSNVIFASDTSLQTSPTNAAGDRVLSVGSLRYRPVYEVDKEFAAQLDISNIYSSDSSLKYNQTLRNADPLIVDLSAPYTIKGVFEGKGFKLDLVPTYEKVLMSFDNNTQKAILTSYVLKALSTFVMSENWFANYNFELRQDIADYTQSTGNDDQSAIKFKLSNSNLYFLNKEKSRIFAFDDAYTRNNSVGKNFVFDRLDLGAGLLGSSYWDTMYSTKLSYFLLSYTTNPSARLDNSIGLTAGLSKKLNENITTGLTTTYNINSSNVDAFQYKEYNILLSLTYDKAF